MLTNQSIAEENIMRKKLFTALVVIAVICTAVLTASAVTGAPDTSPFDTSLLLPVTEKFDIERVSAHGAEVMRHLRRMTPCLRRSTAPTM